MRSLRGPRAFDELLTFQSVKRVSNDHFIADKACDLRGELWTNPDSDQRCRGCRFCFPLEANRSRAVNDVREQCTTDHTVYETPS
jgi:hypothetical protein